MEIEKEAGTQKGIHQQRLKTFQSFGYDIDKERNFVIEKTEPIGGAILEIGTGKGHFAMALAQKGHRFISVDISEDEQVHARAGIKQMGLEDQVDFRIQNAEHLDFEGASFDNVFSVNMVHHLQNPFAVIDEMIRVTKPGGRIIISDFTDEGFKVIKKIHMSEGRHHGQGEIDLAAVKTYLSGKGFSIKEHSTELQQVLIATR